MTAGAGPLADCVVVDLSRALSGPHATMMLADLGARVVKVETAGSGDDTRGWGPPFVRPTGDGFIVESERTGDGESTYFLSANRNKQSICLDLKDRSPDGDLDLLLRLVDSADILVENFRAGVMDRLGIGHRDLLQRNPRLIVLSITGFGHDGPEGGRAGYDQIAQGEAGLMSFTGPSPADPQKVGTPISDIVAGMYGAYGILAALHERSRTGRGQVVRTSLLAATVGIHGFQGTRWTVAGEVGRAGGNHHVAISPYGLFRCADGAVQIAVGSEGLWARFCAGFGIDPTLPGFATNPERVRNRAQTIELIEGVFSTWSAGPLLEHLIELGVPAGRVRDTAEVYEWEQVRSQGLVVEVDHATLGPIRLPGPPLRFFDEAGAETTRTGHTAPPVLGADGPAVRDWVVGSTAAGDRRRSA